MSKSKNIKDTGAHILASCLEQFNVRRVSTVAGESYLAVLDALLDYPNIEVITCRQEGGAAFMAESWGKLTGEPGICFVTRGPGACNASIGIHTAMQDSTPMILFMGQVGRGEKHREAFQEIDVHEVFDGLAKWAVEIEDPSRIPELIQRAFTVATSGRPGPVVIGLPEDMLCEKTQAERPLPYVPVRPKADERTLGQIFDLLEKAERPVAILGGSGWTDQACKNFQDFAASSHLPVTTSFRRQDLFNHDLNCYAGELGSGPNPALVKKIRQEADLVLAVGTRLGEMVTQGYDLFDSPTPRPQLIHIHSDSAEIGKVYRPTLAVQSDMESLAASLAAKGLRIDGRRWSGWKQDLRNLYADWSSLESYEENKKWDGADVTAIYKFLQKNLPEDCIITTDAGNFSGWAQRYIRYGRPGRLLAPTSGAMGYAVPSAVGAALAAPDRQVIGLCGDGGFMMTGQELATAMHHEAAPIILIFNNGMYGTIRMHQERDYPGRTSATDLTNPDFVALAESYGAFARKVEAATDFPDIWSRARESKKLAVLELCMDPRQITTKATP